MEKKVLSCEFNIDNACVEVKYADGGMISIDCTKDEKTFYECAVAFGHFQKKLADFPADTLFETIKDFHNTAWRLDNLKKAVKADKVARLESVKKEVEFALAREKDIDTGVTLPLVSYGVSSVLSTLIIFAIVQGVCIISNKEAAKYEKERERIKRQQQALDSGRGVY